MSSVSLVSQGKNVVMLLETDGLRVEVLVSRERLLAIADAAVHVATDVVTTAVVRLPTARWSKDGEVL